MHVTANQCIFVFCWMDIHEVLGDMLFATWNFNCIPSKGYNEAVNVVHWVFGQPIISFHIISDKCCWRPLASGNICVFMSNKPHMAIIRAVSYVVGMNVKNVVLKKRSFATFTTPMFNKLWRVKFKKNSFFN